MFSHNNCDAIMTGHLRIKGYGLKPTTYNKKIPRFQKCTPR